MGSRIREHVAQLPDNSTTDHPDKVPLKKGKTTSYCEFREGVYSTLKVLHNWSFNCHWRWKLQALRASVYPETIADICRSYNVKWSKQSVEQFARLPHRYWNLHAIRVTGSHGVTCHPTEVTFPPLSQTKPVLDLPRRDVRLFQLHILPFSWMVTYRDGIPTRRQSPIPVLTELDVG